MKKKVLAQPSLLVLRIVRLFSISLFDPLFHFGTYMFLNFEFYGLYLYYLYSLECILLFGIL